MLKSSPQTPHIELKQVAEIEKQAREQSQLTTLTTRTQNVHGCVRKRNNDAKPTWM